MEVLITIGACISCVGVGFLGHYIKNRYDNLMYRLHLVEEICKNLPTTEELAAKILTMKLPINKLPPEVIESFRQEAMKQGDNKPLQKEDYIG